MPYLSATLTNGMAQLKSIVLLFALALPFAGAFGWFTGRLVMVRHEVRAMLATDKHTGPLVKLTFAREDVKIALEWEHSREFSYRVEMYDIARTEEMADSISYWCHHDVKETSLRREMAKWLARTFGRGDNGTPAPVQQLVHFFANLYPPSPVDFGGDISTGEQDRPQDIFSDRLYGITVRPPVPPPWSC